MDSASLGIWNRLVGPLSHHLCDLWVCAGTNCAGQNPAVGGDPLPDQPADQFGLYANLFGMEEPMVCHRRRPGNLGNNCLGDSGCVAVRPMGRHPPDSLPSLGDICRCPDSLHPHRQYVTFLSDEFPQAGRSFITSIVGVKIEVRRPPALTRLGGHLSAA